MRTSVSADASSSREVPRETRRVWFFRPRNWAWILANVAITAWLSCLLLTVPMMIIESFNGLENPWSTAMFMLQVPVRGVISYPWLLVALHLSYAALLVLSAAIWPRPQRTRAVAVCAGICGMIAMSFAVLFLGSPTPSDPYTFLFVYGPAAIAIPQNGVAAALATLLLSKWYERRVMPEGQRTLEQQ